MDQKIWLRDLYEIESTCLSDWAGVCHVSREDECGNYSCRFYILINEVCMYVCVCVNTHLCTRVSRGWCSPNLMALCSGTCLERRVEGPSGSHRSWLPMKWWPDCWVTTSSSEVRYIPMDSGNNAIFTDPFKLQLTRSYLSVKPRTVQQHDKVQPQIYDC